MKTIIVTDPCYLITNKDWDGLCNSYLKGNKGLDKLKEMVQEVLRVISGDDKALAGETGFGDWENAIDGCEFYADSGMVCIVENTNKLIKYLEKEKIMLPLGVAYVEMEDDVTYQIDTSNPEWSIVRLKDSKGEIHSLDNLV